MANCMHNVVLATIKHAIQKGIFPPWVVMKSQQSITKSRFQSMAMWLKIGGGCPYSWICKGSLKEMGLTTKLLCNRKLSLLLGDCIVGFQLELLWRGWCDYISRFKDRVIIHFIEKHAPFSLASIAWLIGVTWPCKHFQTYHWLRTLKPYCNPCMFFWIHSSKKHMEHEKLVEIL
jgi:hypothetical protein